MVRTINWSIKVQKYWETKGIEPGRTSSETHSSLLCVWPSELLLNQMWLSTLVYSITVFNVGACAVYGDLRTLTTSQRLRISGCVAYEDVVHDALNNSVHMNKVNRANAREITRAERNEWVACLACVELSICAHSLWCQHCFQRCATLCKLVACPLSLLLAF